MKKLFILSVCIAAVTFVGCKQKNNTREAGRVAKTYVEDLHKGNYDVFVNSIAFEDMMPYDEITREKNNYARMLRTDVEPIIRQKGGLKQVNVISEKATPDGQRATVELENLYNNGQTERNLYDLVWVDDAWRLDGNKHRHVWHTTTADGRDVKFTVKDYDEKFVVKENIEGPGDRTVVKVKDGDNKDVLKYKDDDERIIDKVKDKGDEYVIKHKENGHKEVTRIDK